MFVRDSPAHSLDAEHRKLPVLQMHDTLIMHAVCTSTVLKRKRTQIPVYLQNKEDRSELCTFLSVEEKKRQSVARYPACKRVFLSLTHPPPGVNENNMYPIPRGSDEIPQKVGVRDYCETHT